MTTVAAKLLPQSLHVAAHPNPSSHQTSAGSFRVCISSHGGNRRRNPLKAAASAKAKPTHLQNHGIKETHLLKPSSRQTSALSCRVCISSNRNRRRKPPKAAASAEARATQLQNNDFKETHLMKVLNRSCKAGQYNEALYFLELMVNKAVRVMQILEKYGEPDLFSYNALINGFCKANRIDSANKVLDRMRSRGFSPDVVTYNIMIGSLCGRGKLGLALKVLDQLVKDDCRPTVITYMILIEAMILEGGIDEAVKLWMTCCLEGLNLT
ncbi:hypothetical protein C1H46_038333 [Malus baccata]|uniref:Pentacotripeptide-repeat region of PRORP domain-containing protein n=1 Tax=Malus baccata TaxID=106549 RepID=A0A540KPK7_MALBA|nr:hypothetical protein C1H46_038333 [Malus baccata]